MRINGLKIVSIKLKLKITYYNVFNHIIKVIVKNEYKESEKNIGIKGWNLIVKSPRQFFTL